MSKARNHDTCSANCGPLASALKPVKNGTESRNVRIVTPRLAHLTARSLRSSSTSSAPASGRKMTNESR
jgi:hypothetical protein